MKANPPPLKGSVRFNWVPRAVFLSVVLAILASLATFLFYRWNLSRRIATEIEAVRKSGFPVSLQELNEWYASVPSDENAAVAFTNAFAHLVFKTTNSTDLPFFRHSQQLPIRDAPISGDIKETIKDLLAKNQAALELLGAGTTKAKCRYPIDMTRGYMTLLPHLRWMKPSAQILSLRAMLEMESGDSASAVGSISELWKFADSLEQEPILISQTVRASCQDIAISTIERLLNQQQPVSDEELSTLETILKRSSNDSGLRRSFAGERCFALSLFDMSPTEMTRSIENSTGDSSKTYELFEGVETFLGVRLMNISGHFDRDRLFMLGTISNYIRAVESPYPTRLFTAELINAEVSDAKEFGKKQKWPFIISGLLLPASAKMIRSDAEHQARVRLARITLAVERYRLIHDGALPGQLTEVSPAFFSILPTDPFDGQGLRYRRLGKGYVVYSVGPDRRDDGGRSKETLTNRQAMEGEQQPPYDITFTVER